MTCKYLAADNDLEATVTQGGSAQQHGKAGLRDQLPGLGGGSRHTVPLRLWSASLKVNAPACNVEPITEPYRVCMNQDS